MDSSDETSLARCVDRAQMMYGGCYIRFITVKVQFVLLNQLGCDSGLCCNVTELQDTMLSDGAMQLIMS